MVYVRDINKACVMRSKEGGEYVHKSLWKRVVNIVL